MSGPVVERGERITFLRVEEEDVPFLQRGHANPEIRSPMGSPVANRDEVAETYLVSDEDRFLACLEEDSGPGQPDETDVRRLGVVSVESTD